MMENNKYVRNNKEEAMFQVGWAGWGIVEAS